MAALAQAVLDQCLLRVAESAHHLQQSFAARLTVNISPNSRAFPKGDSPQTTSGQRAANDEGGYMLQDRMLTEIERQKKCLDQLGDHFSFPLFNSKRALESQR